MIWFLIRSMLLGLSLLAAVGLLIAGLGWLGLHYFPVFAALFILFWATFIGTIFLVAVEK